MSKIAILYDFDKTLCTTNMQEYSLLPSLNINASEFWKEVGDESRKHNMDGILAYMYLLIKYAKKNHKILNRQLLNDIGKDIEYYPGVEEYFDALNSYGASKGIEIEHYVISSGTYEIIEGSSIFNRFKRVYASCYHYDDDGNADWPALAINYTSKTQFLFRINKGSLDVFDDSKINAKQQIKDVPFTHMIYIADGLTDVPCMQLVKNYGGTSIAVYTEGSSTHQRLLEDGRINYCAKADYRKDSDLNNILQKVIDRIHIEDQLEDFH